MSSHQHPLNVQRRMNGDALTMFLRDQSRFFAVLTPCGTAHAPRPGWWAELRDARTDGTQVAVAEGSDPGHALLMLANDATAIGVRLAHS